MKVTSSVSWLICTLVVFFLQKTGFFDDSSDDSFMSEGSLNEDIDLSLKWADVKSHFYDILTGRSDSLPRTSNILHAFGNTTVSFNIRTSS